MKPWLRRNWRPLIVFPLFMFVAPVVAGQVVTAQDRPPAPTTTAPQAGQVAPTAPQAGQVAPELAAPATASASVPGDQAMRVIFAAEEDDCPPDADGWKLVSYEHDACTYGHP